MTTKHVNLPAEVPNSYEDLVRLYPPRKIHDQVELETVTEIADWLALRAKNDAQLDYLELLGDLIDQYESLPAEADKPANPVKILRYLVEENQITTRQLGTVLGVDHSVASRILSGERSITVEHAKKLGARFKVEPQLFLGL
jgi:HTH-type transcriptional regulator / antitoxin HigA